MHGSSAAPRTPSRPPARDVIAAIALAAAVIGCRERPTGPTGPTGASAGSGAADVAPAPTVTPTRVLYPSEPGSFVDLVAGARHGVVAIRAAAPVKSGPAAVFPGTPETTADVALGTGFLIEAHGVFVLTNDHIAAASPDLHVVLPDRRSVPARLLGRDVRLDLALLSVDPTGESPRPAGDAAVPAPPDPTSPVGSAGEPRRADGSAAAAPAVPVRASPVAGPRLAPLAMGNSDDLQVGEWLVVLGDPFGDEVTASVGVVSATGRDSAGSLVPGRAMSFRTFLQTDARIHRGNSGGPVLDTAGEVVGVAVATGDRPGEVSFVIPINRVKEVVDALRDVGQVARSWLGVLVQPVDADLARTAGLARPSGALITEVKPGSPAAIAGLRVGDIVTAWGDREIDHRSLPWIVAQAPPGRSVNVTVWRNHAATPIAVVPQKMPE